ASCARTQQHGVRLPMKSTVLKRSIIIAGRRTSVSLEDAFWQALKVIAHSRHMTLSDLVSTIDAHRQDGNLSSAVRIFVLDVYRSKVAVSSSARNDRAADN